MDVQVDRVAKTFEDENVLITGGLGFMGKVLLERLLRETKVKKIFLLIRSKCDKRPVDRLWRALENPLFDKIKSISSTKSIISRIVVLEGDCGYENLMLNPNDRQLITENVTIIYNFAATVNFKAKFKRAIEINIRGVRELLTLASECKNLKLFCHMSTAFSHVRNEILFEKFYKPPLNPNEMIEFMEQLSEDDLEELLSSFLSDTLPNSYTLTKSVSEALIFEAYKNNKLPLMIVRPAIVTAMLSNPLHGWIDNFNNFAGLTAAFGSGVLRSLHFHDPSLNFNIIPVDYSASEIMIATWDYLKFENHENVVVINNGYMSCGINDIKKVAKRTVYKYPFEYMLWYPALLITSSKLVHNILEFLFQIVPANFIDFILIFLGKKPMFVQTVRKVHSTMNSLKYVIDSNWIFDTTNIENIKSKLNPLEQEKYATVKLFRDKEFTDEYFDNSVLGVRRYLMKQKDETIRKSQRILKLLYFADISLKLLMLYGFYCIIMKLINYL